MVADNQCKFRIVLNYNKVAMLIESIFFRFNKIDYLYRFSNNCSAGT